MDFCGPFKCKSRENQYVLVLTDHFTRHVTALALPDCTAQTTASTLFNVYFYKFGIPSVILSDQGPHFQNMLMQNISKLIGYNHIYSTPYHPQTNGIVKRFNATFVPQLAKLQDSEGNNWDEYLQAVVFAYNSGIHKTTKYSPYELLFGRSAKLPIDPRPTQFSSQKSSDYFIQLQKTLNIYPKNAKQHIIHQQELNKQRYDKNRPDSHYQEGDVVLLRVFVYGRKLSEKYLSTPQIIVKCHYPTYILRDQETNVETRVHVGDSRPILLGY
ncbi:unnamed protein product [Didymodactylos carnosus]|uniref:Integrase catalytic domain-containing protein n=1 Tax=Didymodactylos carnosus TaxID=1234261 RepID=A0A815YZD2_9BILA|nr:unnamed protein product [Didymodactylos carnosus]CAF4444632.1 unnamed protein product [Didymodactylos carnosus]